MATTFPFPASPTVGQQVTLSDGVTKMVWTGYSWEPVPSAIAGLPSQGPVSGFRNRIINPSGAVTARAASSTVNDVHLCDRWKLAVGGAAAGKVIAGSDNSSADFNTSPYPAQHIYLSHSGAVLASPAALDYSALEHRIAVEQILDFRLGTAYCKPMVLSFVARTKPGSGNFVLAVSLRSGSLDRSFVQLVTINETAQKYAVVIPAITSGNFVSSGGSTALWMTFTGTCGTTLQSPTPGAWANSNYLSAAGGGNIGATQTYFRIQQIQLEEGTAATDFEVRPYGTEELLCQRYFQKGNFSWTGYGFVGGAVGATQPFRPVMRIAPTVVANSFYTLNTVASTTVGSIAPTDALFSRAAVITGQSQFYDNWTADAEVS